jgi:hypothetical protein
MEKYERVQKDKRLVELINESESFSASNDIADWLDCVPEISEICIDMYEDTKDRKYKDILTTVLSGIDDMLVDVVRRAKIDEKEKFNIVRLRLLAIMRKVED